MTQERSPSGIPVSTEVPDVSVDNTIAGGITRASLHAALQIMRDGRQTLDVIRPLIPHEDIQRARTEQQIEAIATTLRQRLAGFIGGTIPARQQACVFMALQDCVMALGQITHEVSVIQANPENNSIRFGERAHFQPFQPYSDRLRGEQLNEIISDEQVVSTPPVPRATPVIDLPGVLVDVDGNQIDYDTAVNDLRVWVQAERYLRHVPFLRRWVTQPRYAGQTLRLWDFWADFVYSTEMPSSQHLQMYVSHFEDLLVTEPIGVLRGMQYAAEVRIALVNAEEANSDASMSMSSHGVVDSHSLHLLQELAERLSVVTDLPVSQVPWGPPTDTVGLLRTNDELIAALGEPNSNSPLASSVATAITHYTRSRMREEGIMRRLLPPTLIDNAEQDSPEAIAIPFGTLPTDVYIRGPRRAVMFDRIIGEAVGDPSGLDQLDLSGHSGPVGPEGLPGQVGHPGPVGEPGPWSTTPDFNDPEPTLAGIAADPQNIEQESLFVPPHIRPTTNQSVCESNEAPSASHYAYWSLWSDKYNRFLIMTESGGLTIGGSVPKLKFGSRTAAELFRPDLVQQLDLVAVQCPAPWHIIYGKAIVVYNGRIPEADITDPYGRVPTSCNQRTIRLLRLHGNTAIWMEDSECTSLDMPFMRLATEADGKQMLAYIWANTQRHILQSERRGSVYVDVAEMQTLSCCTTKFHRPVTSGQIDPTTGRPVREIEFH